MHVFQRWGNFDGREHTYKDKEDLLQEQRAVWALTHRPYWKRIWIVHEVVLAAELLLLSGSTSFNWTKELHEFLGVDRVAVDPMDVVLFSRHARDRHTYNIVRLLPPFENHESSEPKDKVFGLLGIACNDRGIIPNYEVDYIKSPEEIVDSILTAFGQNHNLTYWLRRILGLEELSMDDTTKFHWTTKPEHVRHWEDSRKSLHPFGNC